MALDFYDAHPEARAVFNEASDALNLDMARLCFKDDERLGLTPFTQPAILTTEIAMYRTLHAEYGLQGTHFAGHSLGEYTALVAAGVIPLANAVKVVRERGNRMQEAVPPGVGSMAAIIQPDLPMNVLQESLDGLSADVANHNAPNQVVISGTRDDVQTALERYQMTSVGLKARVRMLAVSAPFHSRLMKPIEPGFRSLLFDSSRHWKLDNSDKVASNTTGGMHDADGLIDRLTRQISGTVQWVDNMHTLCDLRAERIVEIGPGRPLRGFFRGLGDKLGDTRLDAVTNLTSARQALGA
jgi:[acyl-carrier-protein] S-malonyltransferase/trans-AT polyketide synthase/acyltransferase/oxidoreductase domain-containing protein